MQRGNIQPQQGHQYWLTISVPFPLRINQPPSANIIIGTNAQYSEKPSQLPSYVFSNVPSIILSHQPTLSPSGLSIAIPIIVPITTPTIGITQSPSNKPSWISIFYQVQILTENHHRDLVQLPLCCKSWIQVEHQLIFLLNNQVEYLPCPWWNSKQYNFSHS